MGNTTAQKNKGRVGQAKCQERRKEKNGGEAGSSGSKGGKKGG